MPPRKPPPDHHPPGITSVSGPDASDSGADAPLERALSDHRRLAAPDHERLGRPKRLSTVIAARYNVFDILEHRLADANDQAMARPFFTFACPDWVSVVPVRTDGRFVLVRQYRHGVDAATLEVPGGVIDAGESAEAAARRELREETGHDAGALVALGAPYANPALQNNRHHTFLALDVVEVGAQALDAGEDCEVVLVDRSELDALIHEGRLDHALVVLAVVRALARLDAEPRRHGAEPRPPDGRER